MLKQFTDRLYRTTLGRLLDLLQYDESIEGKTVPLCINRSEVFTDGIAEVLDSMAREFDKYDVRYPLNILFHDEGVL